MLGTPSYIIAGNHCLIKEARDRVFGNSDDCVIGFVNVGLVGLKPLAFCYINPKDFVVRIAIQKASLVSERYANRKKVPIILSVSIIPILEERRILFGSSESEKEIRHKFKKISGKECHIFVCIYAADSDQSRVLVFKTKFRKLRERDVGDFCNPTKVSFEQETFGFNYNKYSVGILGLIKKKHGRKIEGRIIRAIARGVYLMIKNK